MSLNHLLRPTSQSPATWTNLNTNSVKSKAIDADVFKATTIDADSLVVTNSITADTIIANTSMDTDNLTVQTKADICTMEITKSVYASDRDSLAQFLVGDVYVITTGYNIIFNQVIDLLGRRIQCEPFVTLAGFSLETCGIQSTGLDPGTALVSSTGTITINSLRINTLGGTAFSLIGDGTSTLDWVSVNIYDGVFGLIQDFDNVIFVILGLLNCREMTFDNTGVNQYGTISIANSFFNPGLNNDSIILPSSLVITRRFRVTYSAFVTSGTGIGINVGSLSSFADPETMILDTVSFGGTSMTSITGIDSFDKAALWTNNTGDITNTAEIGQFLMTNNVTPTTISNTNDFFDIEGTSVAGSFNQRFTKSGNELTYVGGIRLIANILITASANSGNNNVIAIALKKNGVIVSQSISKSTANSGGRSEGLATFAVTDISENDVFTVGLRNESSVTNITVENLNFLISG